LSQAFQRLAFEVILRPAIGARAKRVVAVQPNLHAGFAAFAEQPAEIYGEPRRDFQLDSDLCRWSAIGDIKALAFHGIDDRTVVVVDLLKHLGLLGGAL
jgi:hypothetical protein